MKSKFIKAIDKISNHLLEMNDDEFDRIVDEHKNGEYASILQKMFFDLKY